MPNQITRDIYVTKDVLKNPIHYVRGTDLIPIVMRFCDFSIPSGATARIFVGKPDGNAVYTSATIEGNTVTIDVTEQMFVTLGLALMQVSIMDGDEELVTFAQPVMVEPNLKAGDFPESSTDITFLDDAIEQANEAVETATTAAQQAAAAVQNANTAISNANEAIADVNQAVASMNANFANLAQVATINALQTTAKTVVGAINELNSNIKYSSGDTIITSLDEIYYGRLGWDGTYIILQMHLNKLIQSSYVISVNEESNVYALVGSQFIEFPSSKITNIDTRYMQDQTLVIRLKVDISDMLTNKSDTGVILWNMSLKITVM